MRSLLEVLVFFWLLGDRALALLVHGDHSTASAQPHLSQESVDRRPSESASLRASRKASEASCSNEDSEDSPFSFLDLVGTLPRPAVGDRLHTIRKDANRSRRVAVCMTGHIRSFALPGVQRGFVEHVMRTVPQGDEVDVFFYGHLGKYHCQKRKAPTSVEVDPALQRALTDPEMRLKYTEVHKNGSIEEYHALEDRDKHMTSGKDESSEHRCVPSSPCKNAIQFMWFDRCMQRVMKAEKPYDFVIRTRPDVGYCGPFPWAKVYEDETRIRYMPRHYGTGEDWLFSMPMPFLKQYWETLRIKLNSWHESAFPGTNASKGLPREVARRIRFEATLVRDSTHAHSRDPTFCTSVDRWDVERNFTADKPPEPKVLALEEKLAKQEVEGEYNWDVTRSSGK